MMLIVYPTITVRVHGTFWVGPVQTHERPPDVHWINKHRLSSSVHSFANAQAEPSYSGSEVFVRVACVDVWLCHSRRPLTLIGHSCPSSVPLLVRRHVKDAVVCLRPETRIADLIGKRLVLAP